MEVLVPQVMVFYERSENEQILRRQLESGALYEAERDGAAKLCQFMDALA